MTTKQQIRAEIERRKELLTPHNGQGVILCREIIKQFDSLLSFLDALPDEPESEDERIRKALIEFLREAYSRGNAPEECAKWLVWLDRPEEQKPAEWDELQAEFRNINEAFEDGKKEVVDNPEKYGLCKPEWSEEVDLEKVVRIDNLIMNMLGEGYNSGYKTRPFYEEVLRRLNERKEEEQ